MLENEQQKIKTCSNSSRYFNVIVSIVDTSIVQKAGSDWKGK